ncbi:hypothetical protein P5673_013241 [Acropora cervicornis]|uniref:Uncharacterized protein n=1 Tax=Acropora cervicornis TaxID=6130 RepID=A0AAD9V6W7_ACRCE|nr:hypothetical protein P5673_013241 [Acropora cervicornis]
MWKRLPVAPPVSLRLLQMRPSTQRDNWAIGQTGLTLALVGSQSRRRKTLTPNPRVSGVLDSWTRDGPGSRRKTGFCSRAPAWVTAPVPPGKHCLLHKEKGLEKVVQTKLVSPPPGWLAAVNRASHQAVETTEEGRRHEVSS